MLHPNSKTTDMTQGNIALLLIRFSLPLIAGNLFQQLYNTVDSIVVGNYVGKEALAAIGSTTNLVNTIVGFFMGISVGAGVVVSQYFGAHDDKNVSRSVHTIVLGTFLLGIVLTVVGIVSSPVMLRFMATPDDVMQPASTYLRIFFEGVMALMIYNAGAGILRAVGDSKRPFHFLIISSLLNVALDLLFVVVLHWGIEGAAYATIISEAVSALLVLTALRRSTDSYKLLFRELKINSLILKRIIRVGLPTGVQQAVTSFSNVFVQAAINSFGSSCMAGWASYGKIDQFAILPMQSLGMAATTFSGQNFGSKSLDRIKKGARISVVMTALITMTLTIPLLIFAPQLVSLFNRDEEVVYYGSLYLRICSPFYITCCTNQVYAGFLRGFGNSATPMAIMLSSFVVFRQIYLFVVTHLSSSFYPVSMAYPVGWILCSIIMTIAYRKNIKKLESTLAK